MSPRRIPTKGELLRLQKLYRTDRKIAEFVGNGVTEHLVSYWRRKKGIPQYSFPKFSEKEIREVWDRFGDDFHAGMELGISKAAFYNWRRRYKIAKKPEALKLEQLSLQLYTNDKGDHRRIGTGRQTILQKCLSQRTGEKDIPPGKKIEFEPDVALSAGTAGEVLYHFQASGIKFVKNPGRIIIALDGASSDDAADMASRLKSVRDFARLQQIRNLFDIGGGDGLQLALEKGLVLPGQIVAGSDRYNASCGCLGAINFSVAVEKMAAIWAENKISLTIPETTRINITGRMPRGVFTRDVIHHVIAQVASKGIEGKQVEFYGTAVDQMSISERFTLCRVIMTTGAAGAVCPYDATTRRYVNLRARRPFTPILADRNAVYAGEYTFDVNTMKPVAARHGGPERIEDITPIDELSDLPVRHVFLGGAANGRFDDLRIAAEILKGKVINPDARLMIQPASRKVYLEALKKGLIRVFIESGAIVVSPGSPFNGDQTPAIADGETGLSTHHELTFGSGKGELYHVSPATAAASALTGRITNPAGYVRV
jgi:homoaconitase/3-isopropylmalate dehydratase large subunit